MTRGFTMVPNELIRGEVRHADGRRISEGAQALYELVLDYSRGGESVCTASQETLAGHFDVTTRTVGHRLNELEQLGLVSCQRRGRGATNTIRPLLLPDRKRSSGDEWKPASGKEDAQGEEDNGSTQGHAVVAPLRGERAS